VPPNPEPPKPADDEPAWFKAWKEEQTKKLEALEKENQVFKAEKAKETRAAQIAAKVKELGIPDWRMKGVAVPDELDETGITNFLTEIKQELVTQGLSGKVESGSLVGKTEQLKELAGSLVDKYAVE
jgi:cell shape-determining protein MreC